MEAMQAMRQQPPQRIDVEQSAVSQQQAINKENDNVSNPNHSKPSKESSIPSDVEISSAFRRKALKSRIDCGVAVRMNSADLMHLKKTLGARTCQMFENEGSMTRCLMCDVQCLGVGGEFAVETVLFIPNKQHPKYDNLRRFRIELPRVACSECAAEYAADNNFVQNTSTAMPPRPLGVIWSNYQKQQTATDSSSLPKQNPLVPGVSSEDSKQQQVLQHPAQAVQGVGIGGSGQGVDGIPHSLSQQMQAMNISPAGAAMGNNNEANQNHQGQKATMPLTEAERDPFDDGFLICTQLVKTGGADQGGLQVGDVFVEFGHYSKKRFPGLKSIANLVRRSAGKEINVVVWRKLEQMNTVEDDGTGRTVFQKLALKLKPLQSHDADGGGVLGAVINTYPLPEMKN